MLLFPFFQFFIIIKVHHGFWEFVILFLFFLFIRCLLLTCFLVLVFIQLFNIHAIFPNFSLLSLMTQHFEELLLAFRHKKLFEIHFIILFVLELLEQDCAQSHIHIEVSMFGGWFYKNHFHKFVQQRWSVVEFCQKLIWYGFKIIDWQLIQQYSNLSNHFIEFIFFCQWFLPETIHISSSFFVGKIKFSHVWRSLLILLSQTENKFESINFIIQYFILNIDFDIFISTSLFFIQIYLFILDFKRRSVSL